MGVQKLEPTKVRLHQKAQQLAVKYLCHKYHDEYTAKYRELVIEMGGRVHPTNAERIKNLKAQIAKLESEGV
jgi:iron-sulfur cluster repair protein YtfE (RIC family)